MRLIKILIVTLAALLLAGCGGGGIFATRHDPRINWISFNPDPHLLVSVDRGSPNRRVRVNLITATLNVDGEEVRVISVYTSSQTTSSDESVGFIITGFGRSGGLPTDRHYKVEILASVAEDNHEVSDTQLWVYDSATGKTARASREETQAAVTHHLEIKATSQ
jgi:hypothetical protein